MISVATTDVNLANLAKLFSPAGIVSRIDVVELHRQRTDTAHMKISHELTGVGDRPKAYRKIKGDVTADVAIIGSGPDFRIADKD